LLIWCWGIENDTDRVQLEKTNHLNELFIAIGCVEGGPAAEHVRQLKDLNKVAITRWMIF